MRDLLAFFIYAALVTFALFAFFADPPPVQEQVRLVRMLDVTIKDSNTTNRRQRFICTPAEEWGK